VNIIGYFDGVIICDEAAEITNTVESKIAIIYKLNILTLMGARNHESVDSSVEFSSFNKVVVNCSVVISDMFREFSSE